MKFNLRFLSLMTLILTLSILSLRCDLSNADSTENATITINLVLPTGTDVNGKTWEIVFTTDLTTLSEGNFDYYTTGACGSGTTISITLTDVEAGSYYLFATIYVGERTDEGPRSGDFVGVYGTTDPEELTTPNVTIPETGSAEFSVEMWIYDYDGALNSGEDGVLSGYLILPAAADGKEWSTYLDTDYDYSNGCIADKYGVCESGTNIPYGFESATPGTYHLYAMVHIAGTPGGDAIRGDYYGHVETVTIPSTGTVSQNIQMSLVTANIK